MLIRLGYEIVFESPVPVPMILMLYTHPLLAGTLKQPEQIKIEPDIAIEEFTDNFASRCDRIVCASRASGLWNENIVEHSGQGPRELECRSALVPDFLRKPYNICSAADIAKWIDFQTLPGTFSDEQRGRMGSVQAVWIHSNTLIWLRVRPLDHERLIERAGVCRDFMYSTFCRCLNIPARYAYLADIGVAPLPTAMDFHAWFESIP